MALTAMADLSYPLAAVPEPGFVQGVPAQVAYTGSHLLAPPIRLRDDWRNFRTSLGVITDRITLKTEAGELPFSNGRVWLLRRADGWKAWEGWSDADGYYTATGLELHVEYIAVGIDPYRNNKATGAGPVMALSAEELAAEDEGGEP